MTIDPTTRAGFQEIAGAFGRDVAWERRIAAYERFIERDGFFRWHSLRWERAKAQAEFERNWERDNAATIAEFPELLASSTV
jgi:hypothetical protein